MRKNSTKRFAIALSLLSLSQGAFAADDVQGDKTDAPNPQRPIRDKWALVVGVGKFQNKSIPELKYAAKDARDFAKYLVEKGNFAPDHVRVLLDEHATQRRVMSELGSKFLHRVAQ